MKRYRLDPKKPRKLTPAEARRLDATPIDYSDIAPLRDEFFTKATEAWLPRAAMDSQAPHRSRSTPAPKKNTRPGDGL